jgi:ubiquinone/menaquinone biosynthesis C-methylase UbiE
MLKESFPAVGGKRKWISELAIEWLVQGLGRHKKWFVLDAACGLGVTTERIALRGIMPVGIDVNRQSLKQARTRLANLGLISFGFVVGDIRCLPFRNNSFPYVFCLRTLYYLKPNDRVRTLMEFKRVLENDGGVILSTITTFYVLSHLTFARTTRIHKSRLLELLDLLPWRWFALWKKTDFLLSRARAFSLVADNKFIRDSRVMAFLEKRLGSSFPFFLFGSTIFYELRKRS